MDFDEKASANVGLASVIAVNATIA